MPFGLWTRIDPINHALDGGQDPPREGALLRIMYATPNDATPRFLTIQNFGTRKKSRRVPPKLKPPGANEACVTYIHTNDPIFIVASLRLGL